MWDICIIFTMQKIVGIPKEQAMLMLNINIGVLKVYREARRNERGDYGENE